MPRSHNDSGKYKIVFSDAYDELDFDSGTKQTVLSKKKVIPTWNLTHWTKFSTKGNERQKMKNQVFTRQFVLP